MAKKIYSHSKLSTFEQCPLKYKFRYIDKIRPEIEKSIEAHLGSAVHDTLEWLYNFKKQNPQKTPTIDEVITYYSVKWQDEFSDEILIVKKEMSARDYFNKGVQFLVDYYTKYHPFDDGTIECEKRIYIELDENTKIQGFIDRLVYDIENNKYEIHDYKTANTLPTQEKMDEDRQLALYSIAIKELYGEDKEIELVWHYLAHNTKITSKRTNQQLEKLKDETIELIKKIELTTEFPPNKSVLCYWCEYKGMCPVWNSGFYKNYPDERQTNLNNIEKFNPFPEQDENLKEEKEMDIWD